MPSRLCACSRERETFPFLRKPFNTFCIGHPVQTRRKLRVSHYPPLQTRCGFKQPTQADEVPTRTKQSSAWQREQEGRSPSVNYVPTACRAPQLSPPSQSQSALLYLESHIPSPDLKERKDDATKQVFPAGHESTPKTPSGAGDTSHEMLLSHLQNRRKSTSNHRSVRGFNNRSCC